MQPYTRLFIGGQEVDFQQIDDIPLSFSLRVTSSIESTTASGGNSKRNIELPPTKRNIRIFEQWNENIINTTAPVEKKPFYILINGVQVLEGLAQLQESIGVWSAYGRASGGLKVVLLANNADWIAKIKDLKLRDLDWSDTNKTFDSSNVVAGWDASFNGGEKIAFPLVKWKEWNTPSEVDVSEFTPALFILDILNKIYNSVGYTIESSFLNSELFKSLVLLVPVGDRYNSEFSEEFLNAQANLVTPQLFSIPTAQNTLITILYDDVIANTAAGSYDPLTGIYTVPYDGFFDCTFSVSVSVTSALPSAITAVRLEIYINDVVVVGIVGAATTTVDITNSPFSISATGVVQAEVGDEIKIKVNLLNNIAIDYEIDGGSLAIIGEASAGFNTPLNFEYLLEDWTAKDILQGLSNIYNLRFETDVNRQTVRIEPAFEYLYSTRTPTDIQEVRAGFYQSSINDLSQRVDLSKKSRVIARNNTKRNQLYKYEIEGDTELSLNAGQPRPLYSAVYDLGDNRFEDATTEQPVPFFAATIHTFDNEISVEDLPPVQIPLIYPQDYIEDPTATAANYIVTPRILHFFGQRGGIDGQINTTTQGVVDVPACFFVNYNDPTGNDPSLAFDTQSVAEKDTAL